MDWECPEGARRPDGLVIEGRGQGEGRKEGEVVHLIDVFVCMEWRVEEAIKNKKKQYEEIIRLCKEQGRKVYLHTIPVGSRGFIPHHTSSALRDVGVKGVQARELKVIIGRIAKEAAVSIWWNRRRMEGDDIGVSGAAREKVFRQLKKALMWKYRKKKGHVW